MTQHDCPFDLVIAVDWSAAASPGPARPTGDRCWHAAAWPRNGRQAPPAYFPTRSACLADIVELLEGHPGAHALVGFDFPFGYPAMPGGGMALPSGRALCEMLAGLLVDDDDDRNNRFEVASELNRRISAATGSRDGPFWGHPPGRVYADLTPTRPRADVGVGEYRACDQLVRSGLGRQIQSPWKLAYPASVGSQTITGLAAMHRLMSRPALRDRCILWPFEPWGQTPGASRHAQPVVIAEIWPGLIDCEHIPHPVKDARQVAATCRMLVVEGQRTLELPNGPTLRARIATEGWILGLQTRLHTSRQARDVR